MKKVITYGTYDLFHIGHYNMLKRAKEYGDYLIVGVTGDRYDTERGKLSVKDSLATRIENVRKTGFADLIIVEEYLGQKITDIIRYDVDTFVIGDDWRGKFDHMAKYCELVYLERTQGISSTQIRQENFPEHPIGIITDAPNDNHLIKEASLVNGFRVGKVLCSDEEVRKGFADYCNDDAIEVTCDADGFFDGLDIVFVHTLLPKRYELIKCALEAGKHVIADSPMTLDVAQQRELFALADAKELILLDNNKMMFSQVFHQMIWMAQGGLIGDIIDFNISVCKSDNSVDSLFYDLVAMSVAPMFKIMGTDYTDFRYNIVMENDAIEFGALYFDYSTGRAKLNIGNKMRVENCIEIIGSKGTIRTGGKWWRAKYFELERTDGSDKEVYNINFNGNGFRFLLRDYLNLLKEQKTTTKAFSHTDSLDIVAILQLIRDGQ